VFGDSPLHFGRNGDADSGCVTTGAFANRQTFYPTPHCLGRQWSQPSKMDTLVSDDAINAIIAKDHKYDQFREDIEGYPHGGVHNAICGDMCNMHSPNDPLFFLHHANVDRLWWKWQNTYPAAANTYSGIWKDAKTSKTRPATPNDQLLPYHVKVSDMFKTEPLCYTYVETDLSQFSAHSVKLPGAKVPSALLRTVDGSDEEGERQQVPVDPLVKVVETSSALVPSSDRANLLSLRVPKALTPEWAAMNSFPLEALAAQQKWHQDFVQSASATGIPSAALWNHPDVLAKLNTTVFHADVDGVRVSVVKERNVAANQAVANLKERVQQTLAALGKDISA